MGVRLALGWLCSLTGGQRRGLSGQQTTPFVGHGALSTRGLVNLASRGPQTATIGGEV